MTTWSESTACQLPPYQAQVQPEPKGHAYTDAPFGIDDFRHPYEVQRQLVIGPVETERRQPW